MKVVVTGLFGDGFESSLESEFSGVDFVFVTSEEDQAREIKDADVLMGAPSRDVFLAADHLRWMHCPRHWNRQADFDFQRSSTAT